MFFVPFFSSTTFMRPKSVSFSHYCDMSSNEVFFIAADIVADCYAINAPVRKCPLSNTT